MESQEDCIQLLRIAVLFLMREVPLALRHSDEWRRIVQELERAA
jgi:hypothetical protein